MFKCTNCSWIGGKLSINPLRDKCPVCGDEVISNNNPEQINEPKPKVENNLNFDINNDGKVDEEDISLMAKKIGKLGGRPKKTAKNKR